MSEPIKVRASSWSSLFDCAHRFEAQQLMGMRKPAGPRMILGTAIHASTAVYDQSILDHTGIKPDDAADVLVDTLRNPSEDVDWSDDSLKIADAERIGLTLHGQYCTEISPNYQFMAVEMETKPLTIDCGGGVIVQLTGTLDRSRVRKTTNGIGISDLKTGVRAVQKGGASTKGHTAQIGTYELLFEHSTGDPITEPAEIIGLKTSGKPEVATGEIHDAKAQLIGSDQTPGLIEFAASMFRSGLFPPNPQSFVCGEKYCVRWNTCPYHD